MIKIWYIKDGKMRFVKECESWIEARIQAGIVMRFVKVEGFFIITQGIRGRFTVDDTFRLCNPVPRSINAERCVQGQAVSC